MNTIIKSASPFAYIFLVILCFAAFSGLQAKDENSVIIATVDNVKGLIDMNSVQSICNDFVYEEFKFIGIPGELNMYNKDCVCNKYKQFKQLPLQSSELFTKMIRSCRLNITLQSIENATQSQVIKESGGYTVPEPSTEEEEEIDKIEIDVDVVESISIFPNPVISSFSFSYTNNQEVTKMELTIYDALGKEVQVNIPELNITKGAHEIEIDLSHLQKGLYFFSFIKDGKQCSGRIYKS
ncbi:MAG: T9SS type A sorting domain-containing protein [Chitinophagales bacterium]|nr:T9SS type A sorting domain-containing protein [Chitinophagales bacterium]